MKRIIGIDLGTSSSMIKTKEYPDGVSPEAASLDCKAVVFTQNEIATTPTLIRERAENRWYGHDAEQNLIKGSTLYKNFKIDLKSRDDKVRERAVALTEDFFGFLYRTYSPRRQFLFDLINEPVGDEETMVSYPAQWDEAQRDIVLEAARKAGFVNIHGMDEATACVHCILNIKKAELIEKKLLQAGKPLNALIIDMGAGTTDLAFVKIALEDCLKIDILGTWPPAESQYIFGGSRMDELLSTRMEQWLEDSGVKQTIAKNIVAGQSFAIKCWKETILSPLMASRQAVDDCAAVSGMCASWELELKPFPVLDRENFERDFQAYLETFVSLVRSAPQSLRDKTQIVILTGGNSQWYWVDEVLTGANVRFGQAGLPQIVGHSDLLLRMELPTETVARGLVYSKLPLEIHPVEPEEEIKEKVDPIIEPVDPRLFDMPVEPGEMENLTFEQAQALSQYVRRHIAGDSGQQVLVTRSGRVLTNKLNFFERKYFSKNQLDVSKAHDVREVWWSTQKNSWYVFRTGSGRLFTGEKYVFLDEVFSNIGADIVNTCVSLDYCMTTVAAVLRDGTLLLEGPSWERGKLSMKGDIAGIKSVSFFEHWGLLCVTQTGRLLPVFLDTEYQKSVEEGLRKAFAGEYDSIDGKELYGHDIEDIRVFFSYQYLSIGVMALKKGGKVVCCGAVDPHIRKVVATWNDIVSIDKCSGYCYGLQANGNLHCVSAKNAQILCGNCIGFVAHIIYDVRQALAVTRDGRLHCIKLEKDKISNLTVKDWNLFD